MLLSSSSRKESLPQKACGTALVQIHVGCLRAGAFSAPHFSCLCLSQHLPLAEHFTMLFQRQVKFFYLRAIRPVFYPERGAACYTLSLLS